MSHFRDISHFYSLSLWFCFALQCQFDVFDIFSRVITTPSWTPTTEQQRAQYRQHSSSSSRRVVVVCDDNAKHMTTASTDTYRERYKRNDNILFPLASLTKNIKRNCGQNEKKNNNDNDNNQTQPASEQNAYTHAIIASTVAQHHNCATQHNASNNDKTPNNDGKRVYARKQSKAKAN